MGTFLATSLFAALLLTGLGVKLVGEALRPKMALFPSAPRGIFPHSWNSSFLVTAKRPNKYKSPTRSGRMG